MVTKSKHEERRTICARVTKRLLPALGVAAVGVPVLFTALCAAKLDAQLIRAKDACHCLLLTWHR